VRPGGSRPRRSARTTAERSATATPRHSSASPGESRDLIPGGHLDRAFARLDQPQPPADLWWLSTDGIYRPRPEPAGARLRLLPPAPDGAAEPAADDQAGPVHPKYRLSARCFAYVGSAADPKTWHLPYLLADGTPDLARLPKAIQAILSNYRGAHVSSVPEAAIPEVLVTLARTAHTLGKLPASGPGTAPAYLQLQQALEQLGRLADALAS
jgi:hypothetical protein